MGLFVQDTWIATRTLVNGQRVACPFSGIRQYDRHFFNVPPVELAPRIGLAWDVSGNGKTAMRGGFGVTSGRNWTVNNIGATGAGVGALAAAQLPGARRSVHRLQQSGKRTNVLHAAKCARRFAGPEDRNHVHNWSFAIQQDLGRGMILDVSYVGNALRHEYGQTTTSTPFVLTRRGIHGTVL
jgi:hypothetical protein